MSKKIKTQPEEKSEGVKVLEIMRASTRRKERMYKQVVSDIKTIKASQKGFETRFDLIESKIDKLPDYFIEKMEELLKEQSSQFYTRVDPILAEVENARVDRVLSTQKDAEFEVRIEKLEKAVN